MPKGVPNKRYAPEFKQKVAEAVLKEGFSYREAQTIPYFTDYEVTVH